MSSQESLMIHVLALCSKYKMCLTAASLHIQRDSGLMILCIFSCLGTAAASCYRAYLCIIISNGNRCKKKKDTCTVLQDTLTAPVKKHWSPGAEIGRICCIFLIPVLLQHLWALHLYELQISGLYDFILMRKISFTKSNSVWAAWKNRERLLCILINIKLHCCLKQPLFQRGFSL